MKTRELHVTDHVQRAVVTFSMGSLNQGSVCLYLLCSVGQVVLQLAASVAYERPVIGIEKASVPQQYADNMAHEFVKCMRFFGRGYSPFVLIGDDFLDSAYADLIKRST